MLEVAAGAKNDLWIAGHFHPVWSGILIADGKWVPTYDWTAEHPRTFAYTYEQLKRIHYQTLIWGVDRGTGDIPAHFLLDSEGMVDSVLFFERLKQVGYPLKVLVSDGNPNLLAAAEHVYGYPIIWQQCTRHFGEQLRKIARDELPIISDQTNDLVRHLVTILGAKTTQECYRMLVGYYDQIERYQSAVQILINQAFQDNITSLLRHWEYLELDIPRTNNAIESYNRQLEMSLHTINQFQSHKNASDYLNLWVLWRRFEPFTDCKSPNRDRNGKSPLQLAGVKTTKIDYLNL